jgi:hypothetical protein
VASNAPGSLGRNTTTQGLRRTTCNSRVRARDAGGKWSPLRLRIGDRGRWRRREWFRYSEDVSQPTSLAFGRLGDRGRFRWPWWSSRLDRLLRAGRSPYGVLGHVTGSKTRPASVTSASTTFATPINRDGYEFRLFPGGVFSPVLATARVLRSRPIGTTVAAGNATVFAGTALSLAVFGGPRRLRLRRLAPRIDAKSRCSGRAKAGFGSDRSRVPATTARGRGRGGETLLFLRGRA